MGFILGTTLPLLVTLHMVLRPDRRFDDDDDDDDGADDNKIHWCWDEGLKRIPSCHTRELSGWNIETIPL